MRSRGPRRKPVLLTDERKAAVLRDVECGVGRTRGELLLMASDAYAVVALPGELVAGPGCEVDGCLVILEGTVCVSLHGADVTVTASAGQVLGHHAPGGPIEGHLLVSAATLVRALVVPAVSHIELQVSVG
jgi:hypothetical protein